MNLRPRRPFMVLFVGTLLMVVASGCILLDSDRLSNFKGPSWDLPISIPLLATKNFALGEMLEEAGLTVPEEGAANFSVDLDGFEVDLFDDFVDLDDLESMSFNVGLPSLDIQIDGGSVEFPIAGVGNISPPAEELDLTDEFDSIVLDTSPGVNNHMEFVVRNTSDAGTVSIDSLEISVTGTADPGEHAQTIGPGEQAIVTVDLDTLPNDPDIQLTMSVSGSGTGSVELDVSLDITVEEITGFDVDHEIQVDTGVLDSDLEEITFPGGTLEIEIDNIGSIVPELTSLKIGSADPVTPQKVDGKFQADLAGITLDNTSTVELTLLLQGNSLNLTGAVGVEVSFAFDAITLELDLAPGDLPTLDSSEIDLSDLADLPGLKLHQALLTFEVENPAGLQGELELELEGLDSNGDPIPDVKMEIEVDLTDSAPQQFDIVEILNEEPEKLSINPAVSIQTHEVTLSKGDKLVISSSLNVPISFQIPTGGVSLHTLDPEDITLDSDTRNQIDDVPLSKIELFLGVQNHSPLGLKLDVHFSNDPDPNQDPDKVTVSVVLPAGDTDQDGIVTGSEKQLVDVTVDQVLKDKLTETPLYLVGEVSIPNDTGADLVATLSKQDNIAIDASVKLTVSVNK